MTSSAAHARIRRLRGKAAEYQCVRCGGLAAQWALKPSAANLQIDTSDVYPVSFSLDPMDYQPMCVPCHKRMDVLTRLARVPVIQWKNCGSCGRLFDATRRATYCSNDCRKLSTTERRIVRGLFGPDRDRSVSWGVKWGRLSVVSMIRPGSPRVTKRQA